MFSRLRSIRRFLLLMIALPALAGCDDAPKKAGVDPFDGLPREVYPVAPPGRSVDLIFVIDNSWGNFDARRYLAYEMIKLEALGAIEAGMPDLHVGVISSDLGSAPYNVGGCETPGGDGGRFAPSPDDDAQTLHYLVDVAPRGCEVERTYGFRAPLTCPSHACTQQHCEPEAFPGADGHTTEPAGLILMTDERGCPRCRSFTSRPLQEELRNRIQSMGTGCGFEQHFEALRLALFGRNPENEGFSRSDAWVSVLFFMDEDDCSVADPILFDHAGGTSLFDHLGPLYSFRCTRFGIVCDEPWPDRSSPAGVYQMTNCRPRPARDPLNFLHPIPRYEAAFGPLRDAGRLQVSAISGRYVSSLSVYLIQAGAWPTQNHDCGIGEAAYPTVRLPAFLRALDPGHFEHGGWTNFCHQRYDLALGSMVGRLKNRLEWSACLRHAVARSPVPEPAPEGFLFYAPYCRVVEVDGDTRTPVPLCDPFYRDGHPPHLDPGLPQPVCYHLADDNFCPKDLEVDDPRDAPDGTVLLLSRRAPAPSDRRVEYVCLPPSRAVAGLAP